jgi:hypothetical protein
MSETSACVLPWRYRVVAWIGAKALRFLYGTCASDVHDDFPGEDVRCSGCDATRLIHEMEDIAYGR